MPARAKPVAIEKFPGFRLDVDPEELGTAAARDALNVVQREDGMLETRPGYSNLPGSAFAVAPGDVLAVRTTPTTSDANSHLLVRLPGSSNIKAVRRSDGTVLATAASGSVASFASMGTANEWRTFFADISGGVSWWNGSAFGGPVGPLTYFLVAWQSQARLVAAHIAGTSESRVQFSDPGDGTTWGATNYVDLTPRDGDQIEGAVAWREYLFVFKTQRFFVFYGISTDSTGSPVFNYRAVDTGVGCGGTNSCSAVAAPEGVYFIGADGIYLTTGGAPTKVSQAIDALFRPDSSGDTEALARFGGPTLTPSTRSLSELAYLDGFLYLRPADRDAGSDLYALDTRHGTWWRYTFQSTQLGSFQPLVNNTRRELVFTEKSTKRLISWSPRSTANSSDQGSVAIAWAYEVGPYRLNDGGDIAIRRSRVLGAGANVTMQIAADAAAPTTDSGSTLSFSAGAWDDAWANRSYFSRYDGLFALRLSGSGKSTVHRVEHFVR